jgi:hypothetical protein
MKVSPNESDSPNLELLPDPISPLVDTTMGPTKHTPEGKALVDKKYKFSYRTVLGKLIYAYVAGRLNISYAVTKLARHAASPDVIHYDALK